jgi:hypothetical protein
MAMDLGRAIATLTDNPTAMLALLRLQFERVIRGAWIIYAAPDSKVEQLLASLSVEARKETFQFKNMQDLIDDLKASSTGKEIGESLASIYQERDSLNSYAHGGLRAIVRALAGGYETELVRECVLTAATLLYFGSVLAAVSCMRPDLEVAFLQLRRGAFKDCGWPEPSDDLGR